MWQSCFYLLQSNFQINSLRFLQVLFSLVQKFSLTYSFIQLKIKVLNIKMLSYGTWICQNCNSRVSQDIYPCPKCKNGLDEPIYGGGIVNNKQENMCPICTYSNPINTNVCIMCEQVLKAVEQVKIPKIQCPQCRQDNDVVNIQCVYCDAELQESQKKGCPICNSKVKVQLFERHYESCLLSNAILVKEEEELREKLRRQQQAALKNMEECIFCREKFFPQMMEKHLVECRKNASKELVFDPTTRMTPLQIEAMKYMTIKSEKQHNAAKGELQKKIKKLGFTLQDLNALQFYVQNYAPIIIHIHVSKHMQFFIKDTHYRSQFQTNKSSGSLSRASRTTWEDRMFDKKYSKATDFQRVKYGVINFTNDPKGVGACSGYGQSYFLLKEHVRQRCTFTDMDSSNANASIATFKYCFKILNKLNDNQLKAAINAAKAHQVASSCTTTYKEMQIHGPIEFAKDIERIYVNRNQLKTDKNLLDMVYEFNKKFGVEYDFF